MNKAFKYIGLLLFLPLWWLQALIPRKKNLWLFGAWNGHRYSDNSRYLYEYVLRNHPEIKAAWLTRDPKLCDQIREFGGTVYLTRSLKGILASLLAEAVFVSSGKPDVNYLFINGATLTHLWHGNPLKKIGLDDTFSAVRSFQYQYVIKYLFPMTYEFNYSYMVSNAEIFTPIMASSYGLPEKRILETGCPRNDIFFSDEEDPFNKSLRNTYKGCRLVYYMPTFRNLTQSRSLFTLEDYNRAEIEAFLEKENIVFVSKGHYVDSLLSDEERIADARLIHLSDEQVSDINFMLKDADLLITDYSSAYFDFLLTERPLIFAAFDLEEYMAGSRELYFDYEDAVAGPIVKNWAQLMSGLEDIWDNPTFSQLVRLKNSLFNKYHDDQNSKRVFNAVKERLN